MWFVVGGEIKTLLHGEREILVCLVGNQCKPVEQASLRVFKHIVKLLEENALAFLFVLGRDMRFDSKSGEVNRMEREVASAGRLFCAVDIAYDSGSATHSRNRCIFDKFLQLQLISGNFFNFPIVALAYVILVDKLVELLVLHRNNRDFVFAANLNVDGIFKNFDFLGFIFDIRLIERTVNLYEVRIETTSKALDRIKIQVIVWIFRILSITFHQLENQDRENRGQSVAQAFHLRPDKVLTDHATAIGSIKAEV